MEIEMLRSTNLTLTQTGTVSVTAQPGSTRFMMWMYNSGLSDSDKFGAESETCYLVTAISCHSCLDIVIVKPASDYKLIRRFRLSRRCRGSCLNFRLPTGTLRLADYLGRARPD